MIFVHDDPESGALLTRVSAETSALALAEDMLADKGIAALPSADNPSLRLDDREKRASVERSVVAFLRGGDGHVPAGGGRGAP